LATGDKNPSNRHVVCAWKRGGPLKEDLEKMGIPVFEPKNSSHSLKTFKRVIRYLGSIIESEKIDIIHAHMADAAFWGSIAASKYSLPVLITHHGNQLVPKGTFTFRLLSNILLFFTTRYAKINIAVSEPIKTKLKKRFYLNDRQVKIIKNGVPAPNNNQKSTPDGKQQITEALDLNGRSPKIISIGRLIELKGQRQLLEAAPEIIKYYPNAQFIFLGTGPLKASLEHMAKELSIEDQVHILGTTNDIPSYLINSDVYVTTSHHEGTPLATLEAMAWGVPIVASNVLGNRDIITDEVTGLMYPLGDIPKLSKAILRLLENPSMANTLAANGQTLIDEKYSLNQMIVKYTNLYNHFISKRAILHDG